MLGKNEKQITILALEKLKTEYQNQWWKHQEIDQINNVLNKLTCQI